MYELEKVKINQLQNLVYDDIFVMTTRQVAEFYGTDISNIRQNFKNNQNHYEEGKHYFRLKGDSLKDFLDGKKFNTSKIRRELILWTKWGALHHAKSLGTDKAWKIFEMLEELYFSRTTKSLGEIMLADAQRQLNLEKIRKEANNLISKHNEKVEKMKPYIKQYKDDDGNNIEITAVALEDSDKEWFFVKDICKIIKVKYEFNLLNRVGDNNKNIYIDNNGNEFNVVDMIGKNKIILTARNSKNLRSFLIEEIMVDFEDEIEEL